MYNAEQTRENRLYYLNRGRCPNCGGVNPVEPGKSRCRACALKQAQARHERLVRRREAGLCTRCGKPLPEGSRFKTCEMCRAYIGAFKQGNARRYHERKKAGLCVKCDNPAEPGRVLCKRCLERHREYESSYDHYSDMKRQRRAAFKAVGLCYDCGRPTDEGHTRCPRCREMRMDSTRKYRIHKRIEREAEEARRNAGSSR